MKIAYCSDLHFEFYKDNEIDEFMLSMESADVLIMSGDIMVLKRLFDAHLNMVKYGDNSVLLDFIEHIHEKYKYVFWVIGNHELYHSSFESIKTFKEILSYYGNVFAIHEGESFDIDNHLFVGGTCWTDFNNNCSMTTTQAPLKLSDFRVIKDCNVNVINEYHDTFIKWVTGIDTMKYTKSIMMTHHSPSFRTVSDEFKHETIMNGLFASNLEHLMGKFDYWFFGHMHNPKLLNINGCELLSNPKGYPNELSSKGFNMKYITI